VVCTLSGTRLRRFISFTTTMHPMSTGTQSNPQQGTI
jgi:hypothetical protein